MHLGSIIGGVVGAAGGFFLGGPAGAAAGWSAGSSLGKGFDGEQAQTETNNSNVRLAEEQMQFQDKESSTSYQRGVKDMEAAGLNPMLAYSQGGASSPSGAMPVMQNPVAAGASSAAAQAATSSQLQMTQANIDLTKAQTMKTVGDTLATGVATDLASAQTDQAVANSQAASAQSHLTQAQTPGAVAAARKGAVDADTATAIFQAMSDKSGDKYSALESGFQADVTRRKAEAEAATLQLPALRADSNFNAGLGQASPYMKTLTDVLRLISLGRGVVNK